MADGDVIVGFGADPNDLSRLSAVIEKAIASGFQGAAADFGKRLAADLNNTIGKQMKTLSAQLQKGFDPVAKKVQQVTARLTESEHAVINFGKAFREAGLSAAALPPAISRTTTVIRRSSVEMVDSANRTARERLQILRNEGSKAAIEAQRAAQLQIVTARNAARDRDRIQRALFENLGRLERAFGAVVTGAARTAVSGVSRIYSSAGSALSRIFTRQNQDVTRGLQSAYSNRESIIRSSFSRQERTLRESVTRQERIMRDAQQRLSSGVAGAVTGRGVGGGLAAGVAGGAGVTALLTSGFTRFSDLERLNRQFTALLGNGDAAIVLLEQVRQFAKETPFDLVGVADLAKGFLAIGTAVDDVLPSLETVADAVAFTGGGTDALNRIQRAIGQIVSIGRLQGDELNQLAENLPGLNIRKLLADQLTGGDTAALEELKTAGELTSEMFLKAFLGGLADDPRIDNASRDLANTLSGRFANLKESFADFGASLIGLVAGPMKQAFAQTQTLLANMATFVRGDVGPALQILRDAIGGAVIALGGLVAAKAAIESLQLLGAAARFAVTPFGALVLAATLIGAAVGVLYKHNLQFREVVGQLIVRAEDLGGAIAERLQPILERLASFVDTTVVPALKRFGQFLLDNIIPAIDAASSFILDTAVPAMINFAQTLAEKVVPIAQTAGDVLAGAFDAARDALGRFLSFVTPLIQPAIDGFENLGGAIKDAVTGDLSGLGAGAISAVQGIGSSAANIGKVIANALAPIGEAILDKIRGIFTAENLKFLASGFLNIVEQIGFILGNIVSDPRFITAVAGLVAAAVIVGARFIEGVGRGIIENIPELLGLLKGAGERLLKTLFNFDNLPVILTAAFLAVQLGPLLFRLFQGSGADAARGFAQGFSQNIKGAGGFGLAAITGADATASRAGAGLSKTMNTELRDLNLQVAALGGTFKSNARDAQTWLNGIKGRFSEAQIAGLTFRDGIKRIFSAGGFFGAALGEGLTGQFKTALGTTKLAFSEFMDGLRQVAKAQGTSVGGLIGGGIAIGLGSFLAGRAEGQAGGSGIFSALGSFATTTALTGNVFFGAAAGGVSLLGTAFGRAKKDAQEFKKSVENLAGALKGDLQSGLTDATGSVVTLQGALAAGSDSQLRKSILGELDEKTVDQLVKAGITLDDLTTAFGKSRQAVDDLLATGGISAFDIGFLGNKTANKGEADVIDDVSRAYRALAEAIKAVNNERAFTGATDLPETLNRDIAIQAANIPGFIPVRVAPEVDATFFADEMKRQLAARGSLAIQPTILPPVTVDFDRVMDTSKRKVDDLKVSFDILVQAIAVGFGLNTSFQQTIDNAVVAIDSAVQNIATVDISTVVGKSIENQNFNAIATAAAEAIAQGVKDGTIDGIDTAADATTTVQPLADAANAAIQKALTEGKIDETQAQTLKDQIAQIFQDGVNNPAIAEAVANTADQTFQALVQGFIDSGGAAAATVYGHDVSEGYALGIEQGMPRVLAAIEVMAAAAEALTKEQLDIHSPSKVMIEIGKSVGEGFGIGIAESFSNVSSVISDAMKSSIEAVQGEADTLALATQDLFSSLFDRFVGPGARLGPGGSPLGALGQAEGALTSAIDALQSEVEGNLKKLAEAVAARNAGTATASQRNVVDENPFSLNPRDVFGVSNMAALTEAFSAIKELASGLLGAGFSPENVANQIEGFITQVTDAATAAGLTAESVESFREQMGLGSQALEDFVAATAAAAAAATGPAAQNARQAAAAIAAGNVVEVATVADLPAGASVKPLGNNEYLGRDGKVYRVVGAGHVDSDTISAPPPPTERLPLELHVHVPYGDPYAIAATVSNTIARDSRIPS